MSHDSIVSVFVCFLPVVHAWKMSFTFFIIRNARDYCQYLGLFVLSAVGYSPNSAFFYFFSRLLIASYDHQTHIIFSKFSLLINFFLPITHCFI